MSAKDSLPLQVPYLAVKDVSALVEINRLSDYQYQEAGFGGSADIFWCALNLEV
ncbi:hypothetical protein BDV93DRAFT_179999 [Ceratobasidium sp. AG-I]|nr:hypothetical protein BDV93DRAFT_179999 [Ceratobasidium sp. AG-I]